MIQYILVGVIALVVLFFLIRYLIRLFRSGGNRGCGCGCGGCSQSDRVHNTTSEPKG